MKRFIALLLIASALMVMPSCNSDKTKEEKKEEIKDEKTTDQTEAVPESATAIANAWCDLNAKVFRATTEEEKATMKKALEAYEKLLEDKFGNNEALMKEIEAEVEKCEDASEGR